MRFLLQYHLTHDNSHIIAIWHENIIIWPLKSMMAKRQPSLTLEHHLNLPLTLFQLCHKKTCFIHTVMIQSFLTDRSGQPVQTQIRLLLEEQSDQGIHCLLLHLHLFDEIL